MRASSNSTSATANATPIGYGTLTDGVLTYAPKKVRYNNREVHNPTGETLTALGYLPVYSITPTAKLGVSYTPSGWEQRDGAIYRTFTETPITAPATVYSVEEIIYGLITHNALAAVKQIVGDYWELFTMRDTLTSDNEIFTAKWDELKAAIVASGALTEDEVAEILADAEVA